MRHCLDDYLDEYKVVSVIDGQNYIAVGEDEKRIVTVSLLNFHWYFAKQGKKGWFIIYNGGKYWWGRAYLPVLYHTYIQGNSKIMVSAWYDVERSVRRNLNAIDWNDEKELLTKF